MCPRHLMEANLGQMQPELFRRIIDERAAHPGTALVPFFRGESLLHPNCLELLGYAKDRGISPIQFTTNATLLTPARARALADMQIDFISFSVDSIDPEIYAKIRSGANLDHVLRNIEYFCNYRKQQGGSLPEVQVSTVRTAATAEQLPAFIEYWRGKVDRVRVYEEHSQDGNYGSLECDAHGETTARQPCHKPFTDLVVYWDGDVALCNHDWDRATSLGNLAESSIADVWRNEAHRKVRDDHCQNPDNLEQPCQSCDHWQTYYLPEKQVGELYE